jgi:hypothetical protein
MHWRDALAGKLTACPEMDHYTGVCRSAFLPSAVAGRADEAGTLRSPQFKAKADAPLASRPRSLGCQTCG